MVIMEMKTRINRKCSEISRNFTIFSPLTLENFREIIQMINDNVINMAIAENIILEVIKSPTISARQVRVDQSYSIFNGLHL